MTPKTETDNKRPLDFHRWLQSLGMNPSRRRPLGRQAALLMDYRAYLERTVGKEAAQTWVAKFAPKPEAAKSQGE